MNYYLKYKKYKTKYINLLKQKGGSVTTTNKEKYQILLEKGERLTREDVYNIPSEDIYNIIVDEEYESESQKVYFLRLLFDRGAISQERQNSLGSPDPAFVIIRNFLILCIFKQDIELCRIFIEYGIRRYHEYMIIYDEEKDIVQCTEEFINWFDTYAKKTTPGGMGHENRLIKKIYSKYAWIDATVFNDTVLMMASRINNLDIIRLLLENRADLTRKNRNEDNAFSIAIKFGHIETCQMLFLDFNVNLNEKYKYGDTALHLACRQKNLELAKWLVENMISETSLEKNVFGRLAFKEWGIPIPIEQTRYNPVEVNDENKEAFIAFLETIYSEVK
jgi:hypothetical protein